VNKGVFASFEGPLMGWGTLAVTHRAFLEGPYNRGGWLKPQGPHNYFGSLGSFLPQFKCSLKYCPGEHKYLFPRGKALS